MEQQILINNNELENVTINTNNFFEIIKKLSKCPINFNVYRFSKHSIIDRYNTILYPLPFSTSLNLNYVLDEWIGGKIATCCLFIINVPVNYPLVFLSIPQKIDRDDELKYINQEQYEVTLAPSRIILTKHETIGNMNVYFCNLEEITVSEFNRIIEETKDIYKLNNKRKLIEEDTHNKKKKNET